MNDSSAVGVVGATSLVGGCVLRSLVAQNQRTVAFSRRERDCVDVPGVSWRKLPRVPGGYALCEEIKDWIYLAPIWTLPEHFPMLESFGARRVVALSSTSRFTKQFGQGSDDPAENLVAHKLKDAEEQIQTWAEVRGVGWVVLRPTLIYGLGQDKNVCEIARFIRRFHFFPVLGEAKGLRQPIHAEDVAQACLSALESPITANRAYNIAGGEILEYTEMVSRVFEALNLPKRFLRASLFAFKLAALILRSLPSYRHMSASMVMRMNRDLVFDCSDAARDFGFDPKKFLLTNSDLPTTPLH